MVTPANFHGAQDVRRVSLIQPFVSMPEDYPLVSRNLSFGWNRALEPEWARIGIRPLGRRGFCCHMLALRLMTQTGVHRLEVLKEHFQLTANRQP